MNKLKSSPSTSKRFKPSKSIKGKVISPRLIEQCQPTAAKKKKHSIQVQVQKDTKIKKMQEQHAQKQKTIYKDEQQLKKNKSSSQAYNFKQSNCPSPQVVNKRKAYITNHDPSKSLASSFKCCNLNQQQKRKVSKMTEQQQRLVMGSISERRQDRKQKENAKQKVINSKKSNNKQQSQYYQRKHHHRIMKINTTDEQSTNVYRKTYKQSTDYDAKGVGIGVQKGSLAHKMRKPTATTTSKDKRSSTSSQLSSPDSSLSQVVSSYFNDSGERIKNPSPQNDGYCNRGSRNHGLLNGSQDKNSSNRDRSSLLKCSLQTSLQNYKSLENIHMKESEYYGQASLSYQQAARLSKIHHLQKQKLRLSIHDLKSKLHQNRPKSKK